VQPFCENPDIWGILSLFYMSWHFPKFSRSPVWILILFFYDSVLRFSVQKHQAFPPIITGAGLHSGLRQLVVVEQLAHRSQFRPVLTFLSQTTFLRWMSGNFRARFVNGRDSTHIALRRLLWRAATLTDRRLSSHTVAGVWLLLRFHLVPSRQVSFVFPHRMSPFPHETLISIIFIQHLWEI
jgi:hypothetical protein